MNKIDQKMQRLEQEGAQMVKLDQMSGQELRQQVQKLLAKTAKLDNEAGTASFDQIALQLEGIRSEMGLLMRACEIRAMQR